MGTDAKVIDMGTFRQAGLPLRDVALSGATGAAAPATRLQAVTSRSARQAHASALPASPTVEDFGRILANADRVVAASLRAAQAVRAHASSFDARLSAIERAALRSRPASPEERIRWAEFLVRTASDDALPSSQRAAIVDTWERLLETEPAVMYPTSGLDDETERFYFSWNTDGKTLEIQIGRDGSRSWFFADHLTRFSAVSSPSTSEAFVTFARLFLRRGP